MKTKKPVWQTFRIASERNLALLPKQKPLCTEGPHLFTLGIPDEQDLQIGKCRKCHLRWIFRSHI